MIAQRRQFDTRLFEVLQTKRLTQYRTVCLSIWSATRKAVWFGYCEWFRKSSALLVVHARRIVVKKVLRNRVKAHLYHILCVQISHILLMYNKSKYDGTSEIYTQMQVYRASIHAWLAFCIVKCILLYWFDISHGIGWCTCSIQWDDTRVGFAAVVIVMRCFFFRFALGYICMLIIYLQRIAYMCVAQHTVELLCLSIVFIFNQMYIKRHCRIANMKKRKIIQIYQYSCIYCTKFK